MVTYFLDILAGLGLALIIRTVIYYLFQDESE
jgi:uncharacterized membrane protein